jgi:hypothetical protein
MAKKNWNDQLPLSKGYTVPIYLLFTTEALSSRLEG